MTDVTMLLFPLESREQPYFRGTPWDKWMVASRDPDNRRADRGACATNLLGFPMVAQRVIRAGSSETAPTVSGI